MVAYTQSRWIRVLFFRVQGEEQGIKFMIEKKYNKKNREKEETIKKR